MWLFRPIWELISAVYSQPKQGLVIHKTLPIVVLMVDKFGYFGIAWLFEYTFLQCS